MDNNVFVLILEDDYDLAECTAEYLKSHGMNAKFVTTVNDFDKVFDNEKIDILLLDIMLDGVSGLTICRKIREYSDIPIIFLTALGEEADIVLGLEMGADDYLVKPFSSRELLARINRILHRTRNNSQKDGSERQELEISSRKLHYRFGKWILDVKAHLLLDEKGLAYNISHSQYTILLYLLQHHHEVIERDRLLSILEYDGIGDSSQHRLDVHISRLRNLLGGNDTKSNYIKTIRQVGYMFTADCVEF